MASTVAWQRGDERFALWPHISKNTKAYRIQLQHNLSVMRPNFFQNRDFINDSRLKDKDKGKDWTCKDKDRDQRLEFTDRNQGLLTTGVFENHAHGVAHMVMSGTIKTHIWW